MDEINSKHLILLDIDGYTFYVKNYKIFRSAKVSEISAFNDAQASCYMGYGSERISVRTLVDKNRMTEIYSMLNRFKNPSLYDITLDGMSIGSYMLTDYEICGSEDEYVYEISISMCKSS